VRCAHAHCLRCASRQASIHQYSRLTTIASLCVCVCLVCMQAQAAVDLADSELQQGRMEREHLKLEVRRLLLCLLLCQSLLPSSCFSLCMSCVLATAIKWRAKPTAGRRQCVRSVSRLREFLSLTYACANPLVT
jgi:hypothetical protein